MQTMEIIRFIVNADPDSEVSRRISWDLYEFSCSPYFSVVC